jgi:hypothetical protein
MNQSEVAPHTATCYLEPGLRPLARSLSFGKSRIAPGQGFEAVLGCSEGSACPPDINLISELGTVSQDSHDIVYDFSKTTTDCHQTRLPTSLVRQAAWLQGGKKGDVIRKHAELTNRAGSSDLVHFLVEEQTLRSDHTET